MTSIWGPLGWMTLHSISVAYPESPSVSDKEILNRFMSKFEECITCPTCKTHFSSMFGRYRQAHPEWSSSRYNLFLAVCRMHNTVNKRLDKPLKKTVKECIDAIILATRNSSAATFRVAYIRHVARNWAAFQNGEGLIMLNAAKELAKINDQYWNSRDVSFETLNFPEANVLEFIPTDHQQYRVGQNIPVIGHLSTGELPRVGFRMNGGKLRLGGK